MIKQNRILAAAFGASLILSGCGKESAPPAKPGAAQGTYLGETVERQKAAVKTVDLAMFNTAIQTFQVNEGRNPKDLNELVEKKCLAKLPPPPAGMKFEYNPTNATVAIVPQ